MKKIITIILILITYTISLGQNQNLSQGVLYDGEPYIAVNPSNPQHMVVAWLGYKPFQYIVIKTRTTFDGGQSWSDSVNIPHTNPLYGSADPSLAFDNTGNVFLCYIDFDVVIDSETSPLAFPHVEFTEAPNNVIALGSINSIESV